MNNKQAQSQIISNRNHSTIKRILALRNREGRDRTGLFYGEGVRFLIEAVKHHAQIEMLVVCPPLVLNIPARMLVAKLRRAGTPILQVTPEVMHSIAQIDDPQGVGGVVRQKWRTLDEVKLDGKLCWVALESVQSPGNLGSMVRTASAVGAAGFIFLSESVDPYDPAAVRAGMGAIFAQRFVRITPQELAEWKEPRRWRLIGTSPNGETDYRKADYTSDPVSNRSP
jgi:TrmH family RNA methyltransferase